MCPGSGLTLPGPNLFISSHVVLRNIAAPQVLLLSANATQDVVKQREGRAQNPLSTRTSDNVHTFVMDTWDFDHWWTGQAELRPLVFAQTFSHSAPCQISPCSSLTKISNFYLFPIDDLLTLCLPAPGILSLMPRCLLNILSSALCLHCLLHLVPKPGQENPLYGDLKSLLNLLPLGWNQFVALVSQTLVSTASATPDLTGCFRAAKPPLLFLFLSPCFPFSAFSIQHCSPKEHLGKLLSFRVWPIAVTSTWSFAYFTALGSDWSGSLRHPSSLSHISALQCGTFHLPSPCASFASCKTSSLLTFFLLWNPSSWHFSVIWHGHVPAWQQALVAFHGVLDVSIL